MRKVTIKHIKSSSTKTNTDDNSLISVLQTLPVGVIIYTIDTILFANDSAFKILNFNKKDESKLYKLSIFNFLLPEYHSIVKSNIKKVISGKSVSPSVFRLINLKKEEFCIEVKSNVIKYNGIKAIQAVFTDVSDRIKAEESLLENNQTLKLLSQNYSDVIFKYDFFPQPHIKFISDSVYKLLGRKPHEIYKNPHIFISQIHKDDLVNYTKTLDEYIYVSNNTKTNKATFRFYHKNGKMLYLENSVSPIYDNNKNITGIIGMLRDITNEKEEELLRKETEEKFRLIAYNANDIIFFYTYYPTPKYLYLSPSIKKVLGYSESEFYKNPNLSHSLVTDLKGFIEFEKTITKQQKNNTFKGTSAIFQYIAKSGKHVWLEDNYSPIFDDNGIIKFILGISRDITKEHSTQLQLQQKWINYQNLLDNSPIGIFIHKGTCLYANKTAASILEYKDPKKLIGKYLIDFIVPELRQTAIDRMQRALKGEELNDLSYVIKTQKGKILDVGLKTVPFVYNGESCVQTIISDITSEKKLIKETIRAEVAEDLNKQLIDEIKFRKKIQKELVVQTTKYEAIFNNTSHLIWTVNRNLEITSFNKKYFNFVYNNYNHKLIIGQSIYEINSKVKSLDFWINTYNNFFNANDLSTKHFSLTSKSLKGLTVHREFYLHPIKSYTGEIEEISVIAHDTTDRYLFEQKILEQSEKLKTLFDSTSHLIWTVNKSFELTTFNKNFEKVFDSKFNTKPILNQNPSTLIINKKDKTDYINLWHILYDKVFKGEKLNIERKDVDDNGNTIYREIFLNPVRNADNEVIEVACLAHDITENKNFENKIINQSAKLNAIFDSGSQLIWTVDKNLLLTSYNNNYFNLIKNEEIKQLMKKNMAVSVFDTIENEEKKKVWLDKYQQALNGNTLVFVHKSNINGSEIYREIYINPIVYNKNVVEVSVIAQDITERIINEQKIINQSAKLKAIFESGSQLMWTIDKDFKITSLNKNYSNAIYDLYGFYPVVGKSIKYITDNSSDEVIKVWNEHYEIAFSGRQTELTTESVKSAGKIVYRKYYLYPIKNTDNEVIEVSGIGFDITDNKINESRIIQSLKEKEILLKEVHHRVKNNMQVISSILNLQSSYVTDNYALNLLKECQNRVKSMAFIHESLYQTKNFESVNFSDYITTLTKNLIHTYSINTKKIKLILTLDKLYLNLDTSIPCGLIINELISNSLKYAFPDNKNGIIFVTLKINRNKVTIEVGDNGIGIKNDFDIKQTQTLGLQLVDTLIEQIDATLVLDRENGTKFIIEFKI